MSARGASYGQCDITDIGCLREQAKGIDALVSIDRARAILGYEPGFSARRFLE